MEKRKALGIFLFCFVSTLFSGGKFSSLRPDEEDDVKEVMSQENAFRKALERFDRQFALRMFIGDDLDLEEENFMFDRGQQEENFISLASLPKAEQRTEKDYNYFLSLFTQEGCNRGDRRVMELCNIINKKKEQIDQFNEIKEMRNEVKLGSTGEGCLSMNQRLAFTAFVIWRFRDLALNELSEKDCLTITSFGSGHLYHEALLAMSLSSFFNKDVCLHAIDIIYLGNGLEEALSDCIRQCSSREEKTVYPLFHRGLCEYIKFFKEESDSLKHDVIVGIDFEFCSSSDRLTTYEAMSSQFKYAIKDGRASCDSLAFEILCNKRLPDEPERVIEHKTEEEEVVSRDDLMPLDKMRLRYG